MPKDVLPARTFTIRRRGDGRFVSQNDVPGDSPLGVDLSLNMAIGSCRREATLTSRDEGCRVIIKAENAKGKMEQVDVIDPPRR